MREALRGTCSRMWSGGGFLEKMERRRNSADREKEGSGKGGGAQRGVTLMPTAYRYGYGVGRKVEKRDRGEKHVTRGAGEVQEEKG